MTKEEFIKIWQSGEYRVLPCCKTEDGYYDFVHWAVEEFGEEIDDCFYLYRSIHSENENITHLGCSWTPDEDLCIKLANYHHCDEVYCLPYPSGAKAIHIKADYSKMYEEEYVIDMKGLGFVGDNLESKSIREDYCLSIHMWVEK